MGARGRTIEEMYQIAGRYASVREFRLNDPLTFDAMRKRLNLHEFFGEDQADDPAPVVKSNIPQPINPRPEGFLLQFYWQTAQPSARELHDEG